jgi:hypothetical protein
MMTTLSRGGGCSAAMGALSVGPHQQSNRPDGCCHATARLIGSGVSGDSTRHIQHHR